jgi:lysophospholipase L1-like esterase
MILNGIKANFLGDSITEGCGTTSQENVFHGVLKENAGLAVVRNYGKGGTRIARQSEIKDPDGRDYDFIRRADEMDDDADLIVVFGGTNDYGNGQAPLGEITDTTMFTFYGAVRVLCELLIKKYPNAKIAFIAPMHRWNECGGLGTWKPDGVVQHNLCDYVTAVKEACALYSIPVLDLFTNNEMPINDNDFRRDCAPDGLHPNDAGHKILAKFVQEFLETI